MARLEILLHIDDKQADIIQRLTTTIVIWVELKELYKPQDGMTKLHTLDGLCWRLDCRSMRMINRNIQRRNRKLCSRQKNT